jgi:hypothetical protein
LGISIREIKSRGGIKDASAFDKIKGLLVTVFSACGKAAADMPLRLVDV